MDETRLEIVKYGDDVLKLKSRNIDNIDDKLIDLVRTMRLTLARVAGGIGLAAPQVGHSLQLAVVDLSVLDEDEEPFVLINPRILESEGGELENEGCLSLPGFTMPVERKTRILLQAWDLKGKEIRQEIEGYKARVIQHEMDHLEGILIIDHVSPLKRKLIKRDIKRRKRDGEW